MTGRSVALGACASLGAIVFTVLAWMVADAITDAFGLWPFRPLIVLACLFLSLTALQVAWDRVDHLIRFSLRNGRN